MTYLPFAARICLALIFLKAGIDHLLGFSGFVDFIGTTLPLAPALAVGTIIIQLLGSLSLVLGYKVKLGSLLLIIFLIPATLIFHNFIGDGSQLNPFLKNVGLMGGLLMMIHSGPGKMSIDKTSSGGV